MFRKQMLTIVAVILVSLIAKNHCQYSDCKDVTCRDYSGLTLLATDFQIYKDAVDVCQRNNRIPFVPKSEYEAWVFSDYQKYIQKNFNSKDVVWYPMQYSTKTKSNRLWDGNTNGYMPMIDQASTAPNRKNKQGFTCYIGLFNEENYFVRPEKCYDQSYRMICGPKRRKSSPSGSGSSGSGSTNVIVPIIYSPSEQQQPGSNGANVIWDVEHQPASGGGSFGWNVENQPASGGGIVGWNVQGQPSSGGMNVNWNVEHQLVPGGASIQWSSQSKPVSRDGNVQIVYSGSGVPTNEWTVDRQTYEWGARPS